MIIIIIPMDVTLLGIVTDVREVHESKAKSLIDVKKLSIITDSDAGHSK